MPRVFVFIEILSSYYHCLIIVLERTFFSLRALEHCECFERVGDQGRIGQHYSSGLLFNSTDCSYSFHKELFC